MADNHRNKRAAYTKLPCDGGLTDVASPGNQHNKVFIGLPVHESLDPQFWLSTLKLAQDVSTGEFSGCVLPWLGDSAIQRARNTLTKRFLETDCTHLLFIDSDLVFSVEQIQRIVSHDESIVGGLYVKKQEGRPELVLNTHFTPKETRPDGLMEVRYVGTGFIRVARSVFERMLAAWEDELWYTRDDDGTTEWDFWHMGVYKYPDGKRRFLTEDWWFCQKAMDLGIRVWADMQVTLRHSGNALYPLSYQEEFLYGKRITDVAHGAGTITPEVPLQVPALL